MILSLVFYLVVFAITILCFYLSEHLTKEQQKYSKYISFVGILFICLVAGMRGKDVGIDVKNYIVNYCNIAKNYNRLYDIFNSVYLDIGNEYLFGFLLYICTRFNNSVQLLLFALQFLTIWPIYIACELFKKKYKEFSITFAMSIYLFLYFNNSLNMMRQSVAVAFIILGVVSIIVNKNKIKNCIPFIVAILAHKSSLIGIMLVLLIVYLYKNRIRLKNIFVILLNLLIINIPICIQFCYNILIKYKISNEHYNFYNDIFITKNVDREWFVNPFSNYSLSFIAFIIIFTTFIILSNIKKNKNKNTEEKEDKLLFSIIVLYGYYIYLSILFSFKTMYGIRISIFLDMFNIIALPFCVSKNKKYLLLVSISLVACWMILIMRLGWSGSNIYSFY